MADKANCAERVQIATQLTRFNAAYRGRLIACAELSDRIAQLSITFPLLLFALATRYGPIADRRASIQRAVDGCPLAEIADALRLPLCFRRIAPEACHPAPLHVHWSAAAGRHLGPHIPDDATMASRWLQAVAFAARACDEEFAFWVARQRGLFAGDGIKATSLLPLALYAWHSRPRELGEAPMPSAPWSSRLGLRGALERTELWLRELRIHAELGPDGLADPWLPASEHLGYTFTPLVTARSLVEEAAEMSNCVDAYCMLLALDECRLYSMQRRRRRIATLEIRPHKSRDAFSILQLKGPANRDCGVDIWHAANEWLEQCNRRPSDVPPSAVPLCSDGRLEQLLAPYWRESGRNSLEEKRVISFRFLHAGVHRLNRCIDGP